MEIIKRFDVRKSKNCAVIIRYPSWMKFFMRYCKFYFIPDCEFYKIKINGSWISEIV